MILREEILFNRLSVASGGELFFASSPSLSQLKDFCVKTVESGGHVWQGFEQDVYKVPTTTREILLRYSVTIKVVGLMSSRLQLHLK